VGDFNGDGNLDIVVADGNYSAPGAAYLLLGNGDGTFQPPGQAMGLGDLPGAISAADFNGDGNLDFVAANRDNNFVSVFLGNGDGTFGARVDYGTGFGPNDIFLGDINGDGKVDIVTADYTNCDVQILLGKGDGTFTTGQQFTTNCDIGVTGADLDADGKLDLVTANLVTDTVSVYIGDGHGNFTFGYFLSMPGSPEKVLVGDFNGDGTPDIATANANGGTSLFLGNPLGGFQNALTFPGENQSQSLVAADFNGDSHLDLVLANRGTASITTLLGSTLQVTPASLTYRVQTVGSTSPAQQITLTNLGAAPVSLGSIGVTGTNPSDFSFQTGCGASLAAGRSCTLRVKFTPTQGGTRTAAISIPNNSLGVSQTVALTGTGTIAAFSARSLSFGTVSVGQSSAPLPVTLTNAGNVTLNISSIHVGGVNKSDFTEQDDCDGSLAPKNFCTINVTFTPSATGTRSALLLFNDDGGGSPQSVSLSGTGQ
jgi:hypothetical protein